jgi:DNA-directed RNA polymerase subunit RPC12/RpoP
MKIYCSTCYSIVEVTIPFNTCPNCGSKFKHTRKLLIKLKTFISFNLKQKIQKLIGFKTLTNEVNANFIQINALEKYVKKDKEINEFVKDQCKKYNIKDHEHIKQLIKSQEIKNYLEYNNEILIEEMKEIPIKKEGDDLSFIK